MIETGYQNPGYARSLAEFGEPTALPLSGGWFLKRRIADEPEFDGLGCYPYLTCLDWRNLAADLDALGDSLVSFSAVPDPFGNVSVEDLQQAFPDRMVRFKDHYFADLTLPADQIVSPHHRREAEKALAKVDVTFHPQPAALLEEWISLFAGSIVRFGIVGLPAYSRAAFTQQFRMPGVFLSIARYRGEIVAAHVQFLHDGTVYAHLAAGTELGRALGADYALYSAEIDYFADKARQLDWGGVAGVGSSGESGLARFKRGWSSGTRPAYFCGRVMNRRRYDQLCLSRGAGAQAYFPAYRAGEFK